jgi:hypothetical protein
MKKFIFIFTIIFTFCFTASAQFDFTSKNGERFSTNSKPDYKEPLGGGLFVDNYYIVSGSELIIYYVPVSTREISEIGVTKVDTNKIGLANFNAREFAGNCSLKLATPVTTYTHYKRGTDIDEYSSSDKGLTFPNCDAANAFKAKIKGNFSSEKKDEEVELELGDIDFNLDDKPKEKPGSTMPAHLFSLVGEGSNKSFQFSRKSDEIWDMTSENVFKVGKISGSGKDLQMLDKTDSFYTYKLKDNRLYNGDKATAYSLISNTICKSIGGGKCDTVYIISRQDEMIYSFVNETKFKEYAILGEGSNEEIFIMLALLEGLR